MNDFLNVVDPDTGLTLMQTITGALVSVISVVFMTLITLLANKLRTVLPEILRKYIEEKNRDVLHAAGMTIVRNILLEGKDPKEELGRIWDYFQNSATDAVAATVKDKGLDATREVIRDIAFSKVAMVEKELNEAVASAPPPVQEIVAQVAEVVTDAATKAVETAAASTERVLRPGVNR